MTRYISNILICLFLFWLIGHSQEWNKQKTQADKMMSVSVHNDSFPLIPPWQLRKSGLHDAGRIVLSLTSSRCPAYYYRDVETDQYVNTVCAFPKGSDHEYVYRGALWIGGIVGDDTLVSAGEDGLWAGVYEFWPDDPEQGGLRRTGRFADDEFTAIYTDTATRYVVGFNPEDDSGHVPLGIEITQTSYSWKDTLYDDFVIITFAVRNIGENHISKGWAGFLVDAEVYFSDSDTSTYAEDDVSGVLDTLLYDNDSTSRVLVPYSYDIDGDPDSDSIWDAVSARGVIALQLLDTGMDDPIVNFNWWVSYYPWNDPTLDFGPRRPGTPEDPFREFAGGSFGTPNRQQDKYYVMSHPEIDYNEIESNVHDSSDGWIPAPFDFFDQKHDTKFLLSFGPFDLAPGDSMAFALAYVAADTFHVGPSDYSVYFDPDSPWEFQSRLDFGELMVDLRRADSVYRSGFTLPIPPPPCGLEIEEYDDGYVKLVWDRSLHPSITGYYVNVKDTVFDDRWRHASADPLGDTCFTIPIENAAHEHFFAISHINTEGVESALSYPVSIYPGRPHPPYGLTATLDGTVPVLTWQPDSDTSLLVFRIYRSSWRDDYALYDSTAALSYRDYGAESGVSYNYMISARNVLGLESSLIGPVSVLPMALNYGVLFYNMNHDNSPGFGLYQKSAVERLAHAAQPFVPIDHYNIEDSILPFKTMADYSLIVFHSEKRGGKLDPSSIDSIDNYLSHGGKAIFILPNLADYYVGIWEPRVYRYKEGSFFHDILHLDSAITNGMVIFDDSIRGDLTGCPAMSAGFPSLEADLGKLSGAVLPISGYIPFSGCLYPDNSVDLFYRYESLYTDSIFHGQVNGIGYTDETYGFVLFNLPLSLMSEPANAQAFLAALRYLGFDVTCGDMNDNGRLDVSDVVYLLNYLYQGGPPPPDSYRSDVNCDEVTNVEDAVVMINYLFRGGIQYSCCR